MGSSSRRIQIRPDTFDVIEMTAWICDVNGVLIDSPAVARAAFAATAAHFRFSFSDEDFEKIKTLTLLGAYRILDPAGEASARRQFHLHYVRERIREIRSYPHVADTLKIAKAHGVRVGAVTSHGETAEACLVNTGLYLYIDYLLTQEEVKRPKPYPDLLVRLLALCEIDPRKPDSDWAIHIGDSPLDVEAGRSAGVWTIGVTYGVSTEAEIRAARPDYVIHSFHELRAFLERPKLPAVLADTSGQSKESSDDRVVVPSGLSVRALVPEAPV